MAERVSGQPSSTTSASTLDWKDSLWKDNAPQCLLSNKVKQLYGGDSVFNATKAKLLASESNVVNPSTMPMVDGEIPSSIDMIAEPPADFQVAALDLSLGETG